MEENEIKEKEARLYELQLKAFLCGVGTCVDMILDLLDHEDEDDTEYDEIESILKELSDSDTDNENDTCCKAKVIKCGKISPESFKKIIETLKKEAE